MLVVTVVLCMASVRMMTMTLTTTASSQQVSWYTIHSCTDKAWLCRVLTLRPWSTHVIGPHFSFQSTIVPFESCLSASSLCPFLVYPPCICYLLHVHFSLLGCLNSLTTLNSVGSIIDSIKSILKYGILGIYRKSLLMVTSLNILSVSHSPGTRLLPLYILFS